MLHEALRTESSCDYARSIFLELLESVACAGIPWMGPSMKFDDRRMITAILRDLLFYRVWKLKQGRVGAQCCDEVASPSPALSLAILLQ